jgi:uncharacterized protein (TIGR02001 family)
MKKLIGAAVAAGATVAGAGSADAEISGNIALTSDYVFRGISLSDNGPAVQGGFDWTSGDQMFYAGVWGSNVSEGFELDVYGGVTPSTGPVNWDIGVTAYFYPGADDDAAEFDFAEVKVAGDVNVTEQISAGGAVYYAPENFAETGNALYLEIHGTFAMSDQMEFSAAFGNQTIEEPAGPGTEDDYNTWNVGGTYAFHGFTIDLRYHDTDIDAGSNIESYTYGPTSYDSALVFAIGREL